MTRPADLPEKHEAAAAQFDSSHSLGIDAMVMSQAPSEWILPKAIPPQHVAMRFLSYH
jgi:hypothetical protein